MKKYIGTRQIEAEPMTLGSFVQKTGRNPYGKDIENHEETTYNQDKVSRPFSVIC